MITSCYVLMNELPGANFPGKSAMGKYTRVIKNTRVVHLLFQLSDSVANVWPGHMGQVHPFTQYLAVWILDQVQLVLLFLPGCQVGAVLERCIH